MSKVITVQGRKVYIEGEASHPIILMIHGWPDTHEIWKNQVSFFKKQYQCVSFDLPGFSKEDTKAYTLEEIVETIKSIVDTVSPDQKIILMLHDWGCVFGYEYAMRYPDKVEKMIGIDIGDANSKEFLNSLTIPAILMLLTYQMTLALGFMAGNSIGTFLNKNMAKALKAKSNFDNIHGGMGLPYAMKWLNVNGGIKKLKSVAPEFPFYFAYSTKNPFLFHSETWAEKIKSNPENKYQSYAASHWLMVDKADEFNESVLKWLNQ
jgi:pimeloyl-ACP methyl ester carboxylesterase